MPNAINITKYNKLEKELYQKLGRHSFVFINPLATEGTVLDIIPQINTSYNKYKNILTQKIGIYKELLQIQNIFPAPLILEEESPQINQEIYEFLHAQHILQQIRWEQVMPELAVYALEFFLPAMTDEQKAMAQVIKNVDDKLSQTINVTMPVALKTNDKGFFDLKATQEQERKYHLIASKLAGISPLETISGYLFNEIYNFLAWALFAIHHKSEIKELSLILSQAIFDWLQIFAYEQTSKGITPSQAGKDALSYLQNEVESGRLEQLIVFRAEEETPLDIFILDLLEDLKISRKYLKPKTLEDLYAHIIRSLEKVIKEKRFTVGTLLKATIREANDQEFEETNNPYTVVVKPIADAGYILENVQELYQVKLNDEAFNNLVVYAMQGLEPVKIIE